MLFKAGLELSESHDVGVKYESILGLIELLLKSISITNTNKKNKQANKKKKIKNEPILWLT